MDLVQITTQNIEDYRGNVKLEKGDLPFGIWEVFDRESFESKKGMLVSIEKIVSTKNELLDPKFIAGKKRDPRETAFKWMKAAAKGESHKRGPITARRSGDGRFCVDDGNATTQVLMLVGWNEIPIELVEPDPTPTRC